MAHLCRRKSYTLLFYYYYYFKYMNLNKLKTLKKIFYKLIIFLYNTLLSSIIMANAKSLIGALCFITGLSILLQWILVWTGHFPVNESVPGYANYFNAFVLADFWLILNALLAGLFLWKENSKAVLFGIALGSAMVFFGLYAMLYDMITGLFFIFTAEELFGKFVTFYNIIIGLIFMIWFWLHNPNKFQFNS